MAEKCCGSDWLVGVGTFLTGVAACAAVWIAKEPITNYFTKMTQVQTVIVNTCEAKKQADELIEKSDNPQGFDEYFKTIPAEVTIGSAKPMGLVIAPEFRASAKAEVESAQSPEAKRLILKSYWEKSLSKETKTNVDLKFNGDK